MLATFWLGIEQCSNRRRNLVPDKSVPRFAWHTYKKPAPENWESIYSASFRSVYLVHTGDRVASKSTATLRQNVAGRHFVASCQCERAIMGTKVCSYYTAVFCRCSDLTSLITATVTTAAVAAAVRVVIASMFRLMRMWKSFARSKARLTEPSWVLSTTVTLLGYTRDDFYCRASLPNQLPLSIA